MAKKVKASAEGLAEKIAATGITIKAKRRGRQAFRLSYGHGYSRGLKADGLEIRQKEDQPG
jgi:hypothetical protein